MENYQNCLTYTFWDLKGVFKKKKKKELEKEIGFKGSVIQNWVSYIKKN